MEHHKDYGLTVGTYTISYQQIYAWVLPFCRVIILGGQPAWQERPTPLWALTLPKVGGCTLTLTLSI